MFAWRKLAQFEGELTRPLLDRTPIAVLDARVPVCRHLVDAWGNVEKESLTLYVLGGDNVDVSAHPLGIINLPLEEKPGLPLGTLRRSGLSRQKNGVFKVDPRVAVGGRCGA